MLAQLLITVTLISVGFWILWRLVGRRSVDRLERGLLDSQSENDALRAKLADLQDKVRELEETGVELDVTAELRRVEESLAAKKEELTRLEDGTAKSGGE